MLTVFLNWGRKGKYSKRFNYLAFQSIELATKERPINPYQNQWLEVYMQSEVVEINRVLHLCKSTDSEMDLVLGICNFQETYSFECFTYTIINSSL